MNINSRQKASRTHRSAQRRRSTALGASMAFAMTLSACGGGDDEVDEASSQPVAADTSPSVDTESADQTIDSVDSDNSVDSDDSVDSDVATDTDAGGDSPAELTAILEDSQLLCDALDQEEVRSIIGDFDETRPDDSAPWYGLCSFRVDFVDIGRVWIQESWSELESMRTIAADPYTECQVGDLSGFCQTNIGDPELANGWPTVQVQLGQMGVEAEAADPEVARQLAAAVMDDIAALAP